MIKFLKKLFVGDSERKRKEKLKDLIRKGAFLVDVRSPTEFSAGHIEGSVNIPSDDTLKQLDTFRDQTHTVVYCKCGGRSAHVRYVLKSYGINTVTNGGGYEDVRRIVDEIKLAT